MKCNKAQLHLVHSLGEDLDFQSGDGQGELRPFRLVSTVQLMQKASANGGPCNPDVDVLQQDHAYKLCMQP